jgi:uncharacterized protein YqjF (DUF2071 family)
VAHLTGVCPLTVERPVMTQRWERMTFLHWPVDGDVIQARLPRGLTVETYDGTAWIGLLPFVMHVATPGGRMLPWVSHFCETNVRTYVVDDAGRPGIWFFSLDATRLGAVLTARATYRLPYIWSGMAVDTRPETVSYRCRRRWPGQHATASTIDVRIGEAIPADDLSERDHFFTARWRLYSVIAGRLVTGDAWHEPWPLHRAAVTSYDTNLITGDGLPPPQGEPHVLYSPGVDVRLGRPQRGTG